jgi:uncharacterized protein
MPSSFHLGRVPRRFLLPALALLALLAGCQKQPAASAPMAAAVAPAPTATADTWFDLKVGNQTLRAQLAIEQDEQEHGLMNREKLGDDDGMLFVYSQPQQMRYWMMNTPLPLDIGYFDADGVLREVYPMYPYNLRSVDSRRNDLRYALEMNQGWYDRRNVQPGAALDLALLRTALRARGYAPATYISPP